MRRLWVVLWLVTSLGISWAAVRSPTWRELKERYALPPGLALNPTRRRLSETSDATLYKVSYQSINGQRVPGLLFLPKRTRRPMPALVIQHGHGFSKEAALHDAMKTALVRAGFAGLAIDAAYHGERESPGKDPGHFIGNDHTPIYQTVADLRRGVDFLTTVPEVDAKRIGYYGWSLGGFLGAIAAGLDQRFRAVVLVVAHGDWRIFVEKHPDPAVRDYRPRLKMTPDVDSISFVGHISPRPVLLQNGRTDRSIPPVLAEPLHRAARQPKEIRWYPGGHEIFWDPAAIQDAMAFLAKNLSGASGKSM